MDDVRVAVLTASGDDQKAVERTIGSCSFAGGKVIAGPMTCDEVGRWLLEEDQGESLHVVRAGSIVLPDFYIACAVMLNHTRKDFCFTHLLRVGGNTAVLNAPTIAGTYETSQVVARRWAMREIGSKDVSEAYETLFAEYHGIEIPAVMCISV